MIPEALTELMIGGVLSAFGFVEEDGTVDNDRGLFVTLFGFGNVPGAVFCDGLVDGDTEVSGETLFTGVDVESFSKIGVPVSEKLIG